MVHLHKLRKPPIVRLLTQPMSKLARLLSAAQNLPSAGDAPTAPTFLRRSRSPSMERRQCARRNGQPCAAPRNVGGSCRAGSGGVAAGVRRGPALVVVTFTASTASARGLGGKPHWPSAPARHGPLRVPAREFRMKRYQGGNDARGFR